MMTRLTRLKKNTPRPAAMRGLHCDMCGVGFTGDPGGTLVYWAWNNPDPNPGPETLFIHRTCATWEVDGASQTIDGNYRYSYGGAYTYREDQLDSLGRLLSEDKLLYRDGKAVERYREFCRAPDHRVKAPGPTEVAA